MEAQTAKAFAKFEVITNGGGERAVNVYDGFVITNGAEIEFLMNLPDGDKLNVTVYDGAVRINRTGREPYVMNFVKSGDGDSFLCLQGLQKIVFSTRKLLFKQTDRIFELYISYDLSMNNNQNIKLKCIKQ